MPEDECPCGHEYEEHSEGPCSHVSAYPEDDAYVACHCPGYRTTWAPGDF